MPPLLLLLVWLLLWASPPLHPCQTQAVSRALPYHLCPPPCPHAPLCQTLCRSRGPLCPLPCRPRVPLCHQPCQQQLPATAAALLLLLLPPPSWLSR